MDYLQELERYRKLCDIREVPDGDDKSKYTGATIYAGEVKVEEELKESTKSPKFTSAQAGSMYIVLALILVLAGLSILSLVRQGDQTYIDRVFRVAESVIMIVIGAGYLRRESNHNRGKYEE